MQIAILIVVSIAAVFNCFNLYHAIRRYRRTSRCQ